jgi:hypothetical protein
MFFGAGDPPFIMFLLKNIAHYCFSLDESFWGYKALPSQTKVYQIIDHPILADCALPLSAVCSMHHLLTLTLSPPKFDLLLCSVWDYGAYNPLWSRVQGFFSIDSNVHTRSKFVSDAVKRGWHAQSYSGQKFTIERDNIHKSVRNIDEDKLK